MACLETSTGKVRWQHNIRNEFGGKPGKWAYSESPLIDGELVVCTPGGSDATMVALNKKTGDVVWQCPVPSGDAAAYASAIITEVNGIKQYIQFLAEGLVGVDAETGGLLWRYVKTAEGSMANIPTPVAHNGYVYSAASRSGAGAVQPGRRDAGQGRPVALSRRPAPAIG